MFTVCRVLLAGPDKTVHKRCGDGVFCRWPRGKGLACCRQVPGRAGYREIADHMGQNRLLYRAGADTIAIERHVFGYWNTLLANRRFAEKWQPVDSHRLLLPSL